MEFKNNFTVVIHVVLSDNQSKFSYCVTFSLDQNRCKAKCSSNNNLGNIHIVHIVLCF